MAESERVCVIDESLTPADIERREKRKRTLLEQGRLLVEAEEAGNLKDVITRLKMVTEALSK